LKAGFLTGPAIPRTRLVLRTWGCANSILQITKPLKKDKEL